MGQLVVLTAGLDSPGSWLLADAISRTFLTAAPVAGFLAMMAENGSPFQFGTGDPEGSWRHTAGRHR